MTEIERLWSPELPEMPADELLLIKRAAPQELYAVCACFWLFRRLHRLPSPAALLTGDFCFGRFSVHLSERDSEELCDAFSAYLRHDAAEGLDFSDYLEFIKGL